MKKRTVTFCAHLSYLENDRLVARIYFHIVPNTSTLHDVVYNTVTRRASFIPTLRYSLYYTLVHDGVLPTSTLW